MALNMESQKARTYMYIFDTQKWVQSNLSKKTTQGPDYRSVYGISEN